MPFKKGYKMTESHKKKIGEAHKGKEKSYPIWNKGTSSKVSKNCLICKKEFNIIPFRKVTAKFCSKKCNGIWNSGNKNPLWKNNAMKNYPERYAFRKTVQYVNLMKETKKRDGYRCFDCGELGGKLESDHILQFSKYPRLRLEPLNIQTLCKECHKQKTTFERTGKMQLNSPIYL